MITTFHLQVDQLDLSIVKSIKEAFKGRNIEIIVSDTKEAAERADTLRQRMASMRSNKNTVTFSQDKFFKTYRKKIADAK